MDAINQTEMLLAQIGETFQGVELGEGVSLHQALVIDCYGSEEEEQEARVKDEQHNWQKMITTPDIRSALSNAISFFDALGARFHLPVCLSLSVMDPDANHSLLGALDPFHYEAHQLLTEVQRHCIRDVLQYVFSHFGQKTTPFFKSDLLSYWDVNSTDEDQLGHHLQELQKPGQSHHFLEGIRELLRSVVDCPVSSCIRNKLLQPAIFALRR